MTEILTTKILTSLKIMMTRHKCRRNPWFVMIFLITVILIIEYHQCHCHHCDQVDNCNHLVVKCWRNPWVVSLGQEANTVSSDCRTWEHLCHPSTSSSSSSTSSSSSSSSSSSWFPPLPRHLLESVSQAQQHLPHSPTPFPCLQQCCSTTWWVKISWSRLEFALLINPCLTTWWVKIRCQIQVQIFPTPRMGGNQASCVRYYLKDRPTRSYRTELRNS